METSLTHFMNSLFFWYKTQTGKKTQDKKTTDKYSLPAELQKPLMALEN